MTKITYVEALAAVIPTVEDKAVREKLEALKASLEKKSSSKGTRKPTATQKANESHKKVILALKLRTTRQDIPKEWSVFTIATKEFLFYSRKNVHIVIKLVPACLS